MDCHTTSQAAALSTGKAIALVGHPNVGKSALFRRLTGRYAIVSNYPGTTVELMRGAILNREDFVLNGVEIVDTPGIVALPPSAEDEQVTARVLLHEPLRGVLQVGDAKNLRRTLLLTIQLAEMGLPLALALNMMDEAEGRGMRIDTRLLSEQLGFPVVPTVAIRGEGMQELALALGSMPAAAPQLSYPEQVEQAIQVVSETLPEGPISRRALALGWLGRDTVVESWLSERLGQESLRSLEAQREALQRALSEPLLYVIQRARMKRVEELAAASVALPMQGIQGWSNRIGSLATHPFWGLPILAAVLYGLYWFVGVFGAGTLVGLLENNLFGEMLNPWVTQIIYRFVPIPVVADFLVGEYGLWTVGMTYAIALLLPIVATFFLAFGFLEDSGYLPRLAVLTNRWFRTLGLNGKAVLPMVLGLGCVTMATLTTRTLESKRERMLVTLLLALAVPCSAQLGVVMGMLAGISFGATLIWLGVVLGVLFSVGWLAARLAPGQRSALFVELPPMRLPVFSNLLIKTIARLEWYLKEVIPIFLLGTALMFFLDLLGVLPWIQRAGEPLIAKWLGLPVEASAAFLLGFLRRDFAATGLFAMQSDGLLSPVQVVTAMVTITLFIPCIASAFMIAKERGWRLALGMIVLIFPLAFLVGGVVNRALLAIGWGA